MTDDVPPPGSTDALANGCTCPTIENNHGAGRFGDEQEYVMSFDCPLHGDDSDD